MTRAHRPPLSTGSLGLDLLTGGLPRGGVAEIAGPEGSGKETLALAALASCQRAQGMAALVDADGAVDPDSLVAAGVDIEDLLLICPTMAAEAWDILLALCRCGALDLIALASFPGLLTLPGAAPAYRPAGGLARLRMALRGCDNDTALLLINLPLVGGAAVAQAAALRIAVQRGGLLYGPHGDVAALRALARVIKHRGLPLAHAIPLEIGPGGPRPAAELVALGLLTGRLSSVGRRCTTPRETAYLTLGPVFKPPSIRRPRGPHSVHPAAAHDDTGPRAVA